MSGMGHMYMVEIWMVYMQNMGGMQKYGKSGKFGETDAEKKTLLELSLRELKRTFPESHSPEAIVRLIASWNQGILKSPISHALSFLGWI